jgi:hypothetical protein
MAIAFARAFVQVLPDMRKFGPDVERGVARSGTENTAKKHGRRFGSVFTGAAGGFIAGGLATYAIQGLTKVVALARGLDLAPLKQAAKTAGVDWAKFSERLDVAHGRMERLGFTEAEVNKGLLRLVTTTGSGQLSMRALGSAADYARFRHISLADASALLAKASVGSTRALKDVGISTADLPKNFSKTGTAASRMRTVMDLLARKTGGQATAFVDTFGGKLAVLHARLEGAGARIGVALIPVLKLLADQVAKYVVPALAAFGGWFTRVGAPAIQRFTARAMPGISKLFSTFTAGLSTIIKIAMSLPGPLKIAGIAVIALGVAMRLAAAANPWMLLAGAIILVVGLIVKNWLKIKAVFVTVWSWVKTNWPLLLAILTGPIGLAVLFIVRHWDQVKRVTGNLITALRGFFAGFVDKLLGFFGMIIHGAAGAFGWIPGIGPKLRTAAKQFDQFRTDVNNALRGVDGRQVRINALFTTGRSISPANRAEGGLIRGPGGPKGDKIPAMLSDREYVQPESATSHYGTAAMDAIRRGAATISYRSRGREIRKFAEGGLAGSVRGSASLSATLPPGRGVEVLAQLPAISAVKAAINRQVVALAQRWAATQGAPGIVADAMRWIGRIPYIWGGRAVPGGADCSGFVQAIYGRHGISAPGTSETQGAWVRRAPPVPGGLAFYDSPAGGPPPGHVAIVGFNGMAISQGGGMGPQFLPLRSVAPLMFTGIPPGGFALGGPITEPIVGVGRSGRAYTFGEGGRQEYVSSQTDMRTIAGLLRELIAAVGLNADQTAAGVAGALNGATRSAALSARYSVG